MTETSQYVLLRETNPHLFETFTYFIKEKGNERELESLATQLQEINDWDKYENLHPFTLDLSKKVSEQTAREMTQTLEPFRKFDGKLLPINFGFKSKDKDKDKIRKVFDTISWGQLDQYIDLEDK